MVSIIALAVRFQEHARRRYAERRYPPQSESSPLAADIARDLDARESTQVRALHRRISAELADARARGFDVSLLRQAADDALKLNTPQHRSLAVERLNKLRLAIPTGRRGRSR